MKTRAMLMGWAVLGALGCGEASPVGVGGSLDGGAGDWGEGGELAAAAETAGAPDATNLILVDVGLSDGETADAGDAADVWAEDAWVEDAAAEDGATSEPVPTTLFLTVCGAPDYLNGSLPYVSADPSAAWRLRMNRANFTLDVSVGGSADLSTLAVVCDAPLGGVSAGESVGLEERGPGQWRAHVTDAGALEAVTCAATVEGPGGAAQSAVSFETATLPPALDPFVTPDVWLLTTSRDIFSVALEPIPGGGLTLVSTYVPAGDGVPDLAQPFFLTGLATPAAPAAWEWLRARFLASIREEVHAVYGLNALGEPTPEGVRIRFYMEGDPGAPDPGDFDGGDSGDGDFSMIALGGDGHPQDVADGIVGRAWIDWNNQEVEDDTTYGLGVFVTALFRKALTLAAGPLEEFLPGVGTPFGLHPSDALIVAPGFDPETTADAQAAFRFTLLDLVVRLAGKGVAATVCHEMGHSLGLVPFGPPPAGLFAEVQTDFAVTVPDDAHVDTPGLNLMQTGAVTNYAEALAEPIRFNALNLAYLRRQLVVGAP